MRCETVTIQVTEKHQRVVEAILYRSIGQLRSTRVGVCDERGDEIRVVGVLPDQDIVRAPARGGALGEQSRDGLLSARDELRGGAGRGGSHGTAGRRRERPVPLSQRSALPRGGDLHAVLKERVVGHQSRRVIAETLDVLLVSAAVALHTVLRGRSTRQLVGCLVRLPR